MSGILPNKNNGKNKRGSYGENYVCACLRENGFVIIKQNYRDKTGEIDIVAENSEYLVFVEVKTRKYNGISRGVSAVDYKKQVRILNTAQMYIYRFPTKKYIRFDVAEVVITDSDIPDVVEMNYFKNAFDATDKKGLIF